jgi:hypothetical protein
MMRRCNGEDPNLTRPVAERDFDPGSMTVSPWNSMAQAGTVVIQCQCGLFFDDVHRLVYYPHPFVGQMTLL